MLKNIIYELFSYIIPEARFIFPVLVEKYIIIISTDVDFRNHFKSSYAILRNLHDR